MSKSNKNNKILLVVLAALIGIFVVTQYVRKNNSEESYNADIVKVDTSTVESIIITSPQASDITFQNENGKWRVRNDKITSDVEKITMNGLLAEIASIKSKRLASKSKESWEKYELTDSLASKVVINWQGDPVVLYVGKFDYKQSQNPQNQGGITGTTYIRLAESDNIHVIDGFLAMTFKRDFDSWRNATFLEADKDLMTSVEFVCPQDTGFAITKQDSEWMVDGKTGNNEKIEAYINLIANKQNREFADDYIPHGEPSYTLTISGNNMSDVQIKCYTDPGTGNYYFNSSLNPDVYFGGTQPSVFRELFVTKSSLL